MAYSVTTPNGSDMLVEHDGGTPMWVGCPGLFTADDLRDMADALDQFNPDEAEEA